MFRSEKSAPAAMNKSAETVNPGKVDSIMEGTSLVGEVRKNNSNLRVDGRVKGTINVRGRLIVGQSGVIEGEVTCQSSDIEGTVLGRVVAQDLLSLKATAKLQGDINTKKLAIEPGAVFTGNCSMGGGVLKEMDPVRFARKVPAPSSLHRPFADTDLVPMERSASRWSFVLPVILFWCGLLVGTWATLAALHITMLALHQAVVLYFTVLTLLLHGWVHAAASAVVG